MDICSCWSAVRTDSGVDNVVWDNIEKSCETECGLAFLVFSFYSVSFRDDDKPYSASFSCACEGQQGSVSRFSLRIPLHTRAHALSRFDFPRDTLVDVRWSLISGCCADARIPRVSRRDDNQNDPGPWTRAPWNSVKLTVHPAVPCNSQPPPSSSLAGRNSLGSSETQLDASRVDSGTSGARPRSK